jgi:iron complex outermembrane receptor protein
VAGTLAVDDHGGETYIHADFLHRSSFNSSATNSVYSEVPGYGVLNGRIGFRTGDGVFDFSVWARNVLDKNYYVTRNGVNFGLITAVVGDPRTVGATVRVKW